MSAPLTVVTPGSSINTTNIQELITNTSVPFTKLDTQNKVSFQTISILFNGEPAQSPNGSPYYSTTQIYSFSHGYNYIPSIWMMWQNPSSTFPADPSVGDYATTFYPFGDDTASSGALASIETSLDEATGSVAIEYYNDSVAGIIPVTGADLYILVDKKNVYINIMKSTYATVSGNSVPLYLAGTTLNIRCYVFTEPANTSTY
jgi:hypothetical protein